MNLKNCNLLISHGLQLPCQAASFCGKRRNRVAQTCQLLSLKWQLPLQTEEVSFLSPQRNCITKKEKKQTENNCCNPK